MLTAEQIESEDPDSWTGKPDSLVYQSRADVESWLDQYGYQDYTATTDVNIRESYLIAITCEIEAQIGDRIWGSRLKSDQGLIYPGNYIDWLGDTIRIAPEKYLSGINLAYNLKCAGKWNIKSPMLPGVTRMWTSKGGLETSETNIVEVSIHTAHPDVWKYLMSAVSAV